MPNLKASIQGEIRKKAKKLLSGRRRLEKKRFDDKLIDSMKKRRKLC